MKIAALFLAAQLAAPAYAQTAQTCVQVTMNGQSGPPYNCLNQQLQQLAQSAHTQPSLPLAPPASPSAAGAFSETGVAQQYGKNFGVSVTPYRPPAPVFTSNLH